MAATIGSLVRRVRGWAAAEAGGDDRALLDRFISQRDEAAFDALVRRHGGLVFGLCRRLLPGMQDAEDAFQATFLVLAQKADRIRRGEALAGWLHQVSYRIAVKLRADHARRLPCQPEARTSGGADDPYAAALAGEVRAALDEELHLLPAKLRVPLLLCYIEELTVEQAAARLGWPLGTIKSRLTRGRQRLRQALMRRGLGLPAALGAAAVVPEALVAATTRLGMLAILGGNVVSAPHVAQLAQHALATMTFAKSKALALVLVVAAVGVAAGLLPRLIARDSDEKARTEIAQASAKPQAVDGAGDDARPGFDRFGDPLPPGALMRLGTVRFRQGNNIEALSVSPDDRLVVTCSRDDFNIVKVWDAVTGHEVRKLDVGNELVGAAAFSTKEDLVAVGYKGSILLFQASTGAKLRQLVGKETVNGYFPQGGIDTIVFSPDGKLVAAGYQGDAVRVWDVATGTALPQFGEHKSRGWRLAFSPDGKVLATGGYDSGENGYFVRLWDVATGKEVRQLHGHRHGIVALAFSPDGKHLAVGCHYYDGVMRLWEVASGKLVHEFTGHSTDHGVRAVAFTPDGKTLISASEVIRFWDVALRKELRRAPQVARRLALTKGGKTLIAAGQGAIYRWDVATARPLDPYNGHDARLGMVVCSPDGRWIATRDHEGGLRIWEAMTGKERLRGHVGYLCNVVFSPDGKLFTAAGGDPDVKYEVKHAKSRAIMTGMKIRLWDTATWNELDAFKAHEQQIDHVGFLPDNKTILTADAYTGIVRLWDRTTGREVRQFNARKGENTGLNRAWYSVALSPDGKRLAIGEQPARFTTGFAGDPATLRIWDVPTGKELYELEGHRNQIWGLAFSPDSQRLASSGGGLNDQISIWDLATGGRVRHLPAEGHPLAFSADGTMLASASYRARLIQVWDVATGTERRRFEGHAQNIWGLAFSPDDSGLLSASADTTALYWDLTGMRQTMRLPRVKLTEAQRQEHWQALGGADARKSHEARWALAADPDIATFLKQHLTPVAKVDDRRIAGLIANLDSEDFDVRAQATRELQELDTIAETALRAALGPATPLETKRRIERLLQRVERFETAGPLQRQLHAVRILRRNDSPEAVVLLQALAAGEPRARLTGAAALALSKDGD